MKVLTIVYSFYIDITCLYHYLVQENATLDLVVYSFYIEITLSLTQFLLLDEFYTGCTP